MNESLNEKKKRPCVVPICHGGRFDLVHKFPMESERTIKWLEVLEIPELYNIPMEKLRTSFFICTRHFRSQDYKNVVSRHLNKTAIPSLNLKSFEQLDFTLDRCVNVPDSKNVLNSTGKINDSTKKTIHDLDIKEVDKRKLPKVETSNVEPRRKQRAYSTGSSSSKNSVLHSQRKSLLEIPIIDNDCRTNLIEQMPQCSDSDLVNIDSSVEPVSCEEESLIVVNDDGQTNNLGMATNFIEVSHPDFCGILTLDNFWLRDHCRCNTCYNVETNQRKYDLLEIPLEIKPLITEVINGMLYVKWDDGHESNFDFDFLYQSQTIFLKIDDENNRCLWTRKTAPIFEDTRMYFSKLVTNDDVVKDTIKSLITFGFAFIENVPPNQDMTELAVRRLFPIQKTFFGEMWSFTDRRDHCDHAYTKEYLGPHTDNTYFNDAAGLQVLHCIKHVGSGGETILVDGFKVVNDLKLQNPQAYEKLCKVNVPAEYIEDNHHHMHTAPVIRVNSITNEPEQIRFNIYDRSVFNTLPQTKMFEFYKAFRELIKLVNCEENKWKFKLNPGTVLIIDNWRVLHGREMYTGIREITGCYVSRTDFMSKARILGLTS